MYTVTDVQLRRNPKATGALHKLVVRAGSGGGGARGAGASLQGGEPTFLLEVFSPGRQFTFGGKDRAGMQQWLEVRC